MITIFINDYPIYLTNSLAYKSKKHFYGYKDIDTHLLVKKLEQEKIKKVYLYHNNLDELMSFFMNQFKVVKAAGGKVLNAKSEILFIYRENKWDLPKGKIEKNETIEQAALREVEEETGVKNLTISNPIETTYHIFKRKNKHQIKLTYWFEMKTDFIGELHPQIEEGITRVEWLNKKQIDKAMKNTYANIKLILQVTD